MSREAVIAVRRATISEDITEMKVSFEWAGSLKEPASVPSETTFPSDAAPLLRRAASLLRPPAKRASERMIGMVVLMRRGDIFDEFGLQTIRRGRPTEVQVTIPATRRDELIGWYRSGGTVVVDGNVEAVRGKKPRVDGPQAVHPLSDTYLFDDN